MADDYEPSRFLFTSSGQIVLTDFEEVANEIGTFTVLVVDARSAMIERESVFDVFDSDGTCVDYYQTLYDMKEGDFKPRVTKLAFGDEYLWNPNLLILDRLVVYQEYRGHGYGLLALRALIHRFRTSVGLIAMKPFPLQFESIFSGGDHADEARALGLNAFSAPSEKATERLRRYYARLGFVRLPRTEYMVRSPDLPLPSAESLTS